MLHEHDAIGHEKSHENFFASLWNSPPSAMLWRIHVHIHISSLCVLYIYHSDVFLGRGNASYPTFPPITPEHVGYPF